ncbi:hypothetical protein TRFO_02632 [Tritrichomonas foetus]|uniref:Stealth protein CR2 conserved region 2 domain-containing protein n=1 Tax=Tritrichomonas foetus TaxID=1144522 RepID=A0A1J4L3A9_9EUKA|nr:hypothetical protein TRFO_02632 [Tritrichomonas foetus]|eukprot:OHT16397.1 hypothetical protein TRFO_02632 [Tritrichomonas foetus]
MKKENQKITKSFFENRYEDIEELRYSLRTIEKYAKFVNHIFIITEGHRPSWINDQHPKLTFVNHSSIFPSHYQINGKKISHSNLLPTFNSIAIEFAMVNIPELSEHFIYLNDDVFFGQQVYPSDFFTKEGKPIYFSHHSPKEFNNQAMTKSYNTNLRFVKASQSGAIYGCAVIHTKRVILDKFHTILPYELEHVSFPLTKTLYQKVFENFEEDIVETMKSKFRTIHNLHMQTLFFQQAMIGDPHKTYGYRKDNTKNITRFFMVKKPKEIFELKMSYFTQLPKIFCINIDSSDVRSKILAFLEVFTINSSSFEKIKTPHNISQDDFEYWRNYTIGLKEYTNSLRLKNNYKNQYSQSKYSYNKKRAWYSLQ